MAKKVLWIDDSPDQVADIAESIRDEGFPVELVASASEGAFLLADRPEQYFAVIVDLLMTGESITVPGERGPELLDTFHGLNAGMVFGRWVRRRFPALNVIGVSVKSDTQDEQVKWFNTVGDGYFDKYSLFTSPRPLTNLLTLLAGPESPIKMLKTFVIHGHEDGTKDELLRYLKKMLRIPEPIVIRANSAEEKTLFETIEDDPAVFTLAFALLPSLAAAPSSDATHKNRSRQHIIFATGFLSAKCLQNRGKVIMLHKKDAELPEGIPHVVYVDISKGIEAVDEQIRQEVAEYLPLLRKK